GNSLRRWRAIAVLSFAAALSVKNTSALTFLAFLTLVITQPGVALRRRLGEAGGMLAAVLALFSLWSLYYVRHGYTFSEWFRYEWIVNTALTRVIPQHHAGCEPWQWLIDWKP